MHRLFCVCHWCGSFESKPLFEGCGGWEHKFICLQYVNLCCTSPINSHGVCRGCAGTLTFNEGYICGRTSWGVHSPIFCCEGNIRGRTSWVCIHPYSVVKATSVAVCRGCAFTRTLMKAVVYSLPCAVKPGTMSVCNRVSVVWCLCKHFHVGLKQREKRRENGYERQMSLGILASSLLSCSCSLCYAFTHTDMRTHTYCQMGWGSDHIHEHTNICSW